MSSARVCRTRLIPDSPATQDNFSTHDTTSPHKKVARAIADLIRSDEEGGKSIGLEGGWGSGKTTIVSLLGDELKQNPNYKVVLFDAWAHEGDPLRRTFLENLIERLTDSADSQKIWIDKPYWEERKEIIAQRKEIRETSTEPQIMSLGYVVIFLIALVPVGLALLNASLKDVAFTLDPSLTISWKFIIGLLMSIAPLLAIIGAFLWSRIKPFLVKKPGSSATASGLIWAMLVNKAITRETTKTNKTANPTSVEFEYYFAELMKEALSGNGTNQGRKIVLVLDNLDRINPAEALKILSTLQTFLNPRAKSSDTWHKRVWVLIPYDFEGLSQLWGKEKSENREPAKAQVQAETNKENPATQPLNEPSEPGANQPLPSENVVALSFLDKSFQLRFEVPPPVLSRWRSYLIGLLNQAFPDHNKEDFHSLYRLYAWYLNKTGKLPTPRQLKLYVNQIGSIHRQWQDEFHISHMAYYVLLRRMNYPVVDLVLSGALPTPDVEPLIAADATDTLAALAFNTPVVEAKQIRLNNPIQQAFETRIPKTLEDSYQAHHDKGFWEALEGMAQSEWKSYSNVLLTNVAYCIQQVDLFNKPLDESYKPLASSVKNSLRKRAELMRDWGSLDKQMAEGIIAFFELFPEASFAKPIMRALANGITVKDSGNAYRPINYSTWSESIKTIKEKLTALSIEKPYLEEFITPIQERLTPPQPIQDIELQFLLESLCELSLWDSSANQVIASLAVNGELLHYLNYFAGDKLNEGGNREPNVLYVVALCSAIFLLHNPHLVMPSPVGISNNGYELLIQLITEESIDFGYNMSFLIPVPTGSLAVPFKSYFSDFLTKHNGLLNLFEIHNANKATEPFVIECLKIVAPSDKTPYVFTPELIEREWQLFDKLTEGEFNASPLDKLVRRSIESSNFIDEVCATTFNPELARLYSSMALQGADKHSRFPDWIRAGLQSVSKETWVKDFDKPFRRQLIRLLTSVSTITRNLPLTSYQDALVDIAKDSLVTKENRRARITAVDGKLKGVSSLIVSPNEAASLIRLVGDDSAQSELRGKIFEVALEANGEISQEFFNIFGNEIIVPEILYNDPRVFSGLLTPLLDTAQTFRSNWVAKLLQDNPELLEKHTNPEAAQGFRWFVRQKLDELFANKKVYLTANDNKPPTLSLPIGRDGEVWIPDPPEMANLSPEETASPPLSKTYQVDPVTAAFAIHSGWFEETPDSPYTWRANQNSDKELATNDPIMDVAISTGVMPNVNA